MVKKLFSIFAAVFTSLSAMAIDINYTVDLHEGITLGEIYESLKCDNDVLGEMREINLIAFDFLSWSSSISQSDYVCSSLLNDKRNLSVVLSLNDDNFNFFYQNCGDVNITINGEKANVKALGSALHVYVPFYIPPVEADFAITGLDTDCGNKTITEALKNVKVPSDEELAVAGLKLDKVFVSKNKTSPQANPLQVESILFPGSTYYFVAMFERTLNVDMSKIAMTINEVSVEGEGNKLLYWYVYEFTTPSLSADFVISGFDTDCGQKTVAEALKDVKVPSDEDWAMAGLKLNKMFISENATDPQANPLNEKTILSSGSTYYFVAMFDRTVEMDMSQVKMTINDVSIEGEGNKWLYWFVYKFTTEFVEFHVTGLNETFDGMTVDEVLNDVKVSAENLAALNLELNRIYISYNADFTPLFGTEVLSKGASYDFVVEFTKLKDVNISAVRMSVNGSENRGCEDEERVVFPYTFTVASTTSSPSTAATMATLYAEGGKIECSGEVTKIYDANGVNVTASNGSLKSGVYIVECDGVMSKVIMQ